MDSLGRGDLSRICTQPHSHMKLDESPEKALLLPDDAGTVPGFIKLTDLPAAAMHIVNALSSPYIKFQYTLF